MTELGKYKAGEEPRAGGDIELGNTSAVGTNLERFFADVEGVNAELAELEEIHRRLREANGNSKSLHQSSADVSAALEKAKQVKLKLETLDSSNVSNRAAPGSPATDRTPTSVVAGLRMKLKETMESFDSLRLRISSDYREAIGRLYFTVTGNTPQEAALDDLISSGEAERFLEQQGGGGEAMDVVTELRERRDVVKEIEKSLLELHQLFLDMAVLLDAQAQQLNNVTRANSFKVTRANSFKVTRTIFIIVIIVLVIVLVITLSIVLDNRIKLKGRRSRRRGRIGRKMAFSDIFYSFTY